MSTGGLEPGCTCGAWWGIVPPGPCPYHQRWWHPAPPVQPWPSLPIAAPRLSDDDVERIARRVAEIMREAKP